MKGPLPRVRMVTWAMIESFLFLPLQDEQGLHGTFPRPLIVGLGLFFWGLLIVLLRFLLSSSIRPVAKIELMAQVAARLPLEFYDLGRIDG